MEIPGQRTHPDTADTDEVDVFYICQIHHPFCTVFIMVSAITSSAFLIPSGAIFLLSFSLRA
jgi:hypothetical protein